MELDRVLDDEVKVAKLNLLYSAYRVGYYGRVSFHLRRVTDIYVDDKKDADYYMSLLDYDEHPEILQGEDEEGTCMLTIHELLADFLQKIDEKYFVVDAGIAEVVRALNKKGFRTEYSCQGHIFDIDKGDIAATGPYVSFYIEDYNNVIRLLDQIKRDAYTTVEITYCTERKLKAGQREPIEWNVVINPSYRLTQDFLDSHDNKITEEILQSFKSWIDLRLTPIVDTLVNN